MRGARRPASSRRPLSDGDRRSRDPERAARRTTLARLEVQVEPGRAGVERCGGFDAAHPVLVELRRRVGERLARAIGLTAEVTLVAPRTLPRSEGKAVRVVVRAAAEGEASL